MTFNETEVTLKAPHGTFPTRTYSLQPLDIVGPLQRHLAFTLICLQELSEICVS